MQVNAKINTNENLIRTTFEYLNIKDLSSASQVNQLFKRTTNYFNQYWKDACRKIFCSEIEKYSILKNNNDPKIEEIKENGIDYKQFMEIGFFIKNSWKLIKFDDPALSESLDNVHQEIYHNLKEYYLIPKLRKENLYVESEINNLFQTSLYDFVFDSQDLYDYYDPFLRNYNFLNPIDFEPRNTELAFCGFFQNFGFYLETFEANRDHQIALGKLRWYCYDELYINLNDEFHIQKGNNMMMDEGFENKYLEFDFQMKMIEDIIAKFKNNNIISLLNCLIMTFTYFCKLNLQIISSCNDDIIFLNELVKRHKSYTDAAIYFNDILENINVMTNYLYENIFKNFPDFPKFSILRLMMVIWNREVISKLEDENNLISLKTLKTIKNYISKDLSKLVDFPKNNDYNSDMDEFMNDNFMNEENTNNNKTISSLNSETSCNSRNSLQKNLLDDYNSISQVEFLIEQTFSLFIDMSCNEFSIFHFNSSKMIFNKHYDYLEMNLLSYIVDIVRNSKKNKNEILTYFKNNDLFRTKLTNRTRFKLVTGICNNIINICNDEILCSFEEYLVKINNFRPDYITYFKVHGDQPDSTTECIYKSLVSYLKKNFQDENLTNYYSLLFLREQIKIKSSSVNILIEASEWLKNQTEFVEATDKLIEGENNRRNIKLEREDEEKLFNFSTNASWNFIEYLFNKENLNKENDDFDKMNNSLTLSNEDDMELSLGKK